MYHAYVLRSDKNGRLYKGSCQGRCAARIVSDGTFKAMQVVAGVALPKDATLTISAE